LEIVIDCLGSFILEFFYGFGGVSVSNQRREVCGMCDGAPSL